VVVVVLPVPTGEVSAAVVVSNYLKFLEFRRSKGANEIFLFQVAEVSSRRSAPQLRSWVIISDIKILKSCH
jgi:hypothetical protein